MKSWNSISVAMMMGVSLIALTACEEPKVDAAVFESLQQCYDDPSVNNDRCKVNYKEAQGQHAAVAPKYSSEADCQADFGTGRCEKAPYRTSS